MDAIAEELARQESPIMGARYLSAVALSCLLYDHLLHFDDEFTDIWLNLRRRTILKSLFLLGRYCAIIIVVYTSISLGSFNTKMESQDCQIWITVVDIFSVFSLVGTEGIVIYRLRSLWHFNRSITRAITVMVIVVFITAAVCVSFQTVNFRHFFRPEQGLPGCLFHQPSPKPFAYILVLGLVFVVWDIFNICIFTVNTFATPYLYSSDILKRFQRDGGRYFLYLLVVHSLFLFSNAFGKTSRLSTIPYVNPVEAITTTLTHMGPILTYIHLFRLVMALTTVINARIFHGIASEAEKRADEYNIILPKVTNR